MADAMRLGYEQPSRRGRSYAFMMVGFVFFVTRIALLGIFILGDAIGAPYGYVTVDRGSPYAIEPVIAYAGYPLSVTMPAELAYSLSNPRISPKEERKEALYRLADKVGIPVRRVDSGMGVIRDELSINRNSSSLGGLDFSSDFLLDWDEVGLRAEFGDVRGMRPSLEFSNKYQGFLIVKSRNFIDRRFVAELDKLYYTASVPLEELSVERFFSSMNLFGFFVK